MTETFVPANQTQGYVQAIRGESATPPRAVDTMVSRDPNHSAQLALAQEVMGRASFTELMQRGAGLETAYRNMPAKVTNEAEFKQVSEMFAEAKDVYNTAEEMRKTAIAFPDKYVRMTNKLIKETLKDPMNLVRMGAGRKRDDWIAAEEAKQKAAEPVVSSPVTDMDAPPSAPLSPPPSASMKTEHGSVHQRETLVVEVTDPMKLLKAIISTQKGNAMYTEELVEFKQGELRKMVEAVPRKSSWPGLKVERVKKSV